MDSLLDYGLTNVTFTFADWLHFLEFRAPANPAITANIHSTDTFLVIFTRKTMDEEAHTIVIDS